MNLKNLATAVLASLTAHDFTVTDTVVEPSRGPDLAEVPTRLGPTARKAVARMHPEGIYRHQALAINALLAGEDVVLTTPTASGKSLVFRAVARELMAQNPNARVLALFPTQALAEDQAQGWTRFGIKPAMIHGGVPQAQRASLLARHQVVLMTPDVAHTWLLGADDPANREFLNQLALLVLDEAHQYDGVFGTNMAFFMRRLTAAAGRFRFVAASATLDNAADFVSRLTGRRLREIGASMDGTGSPGRVVVRVSHPGGRQARQALVRALTSLDHQEGPARFLAFVDGRQEVEHLADTAAGVLPYRAGYETDDRTAIQTALASGGCRGVVSTSALEVGVDIGALDVVALLGAPRSAKSVRQRVGRCGRARPGVCVVLDDREVVSSTPGAFAAWLARPSESNALYVDNRFLQYAHALCAAQELRARGVSATDAAEEEAFSGLPDAFIALLLNELDPREPIADDLYTLKQRASGNSPHHEFPLRTGGAQASWEVHCRGEKLGSVTHAQMLREAYPGATYAHYGRVYRVTRINRRTRAVEVDRAYRLASTYPLWQSIAFPSFDKAFGLRRSATGFLAEVAVQVNERVIGFQQGGRSGEKHLYGSSSSFSSREIGGLLSTTGVCWFFDGVGGGPEAVGRRVLEAFCADHGVHTGDVQASTFIARATPLGREVRGLVVYDATPGSLRLTSQLLANFADVVERARERAAEEAASGDADAAAVLVDLVALAAELPSLQEKRTDEPEFSPFRASDDWMDMVAPGETALLLDTDGTASEVLVDSFRYTPQGVMYGLPVDARGVRRSVAHARVRPLGSLTRMVRWNTTTDERLAL